MSNLSSSSKSPKTVLPCNPSDDVLGFLSKRRSTPLPLLGQPGPDTKTLDMILELASRVPDHRKVVPWRFIVFAGEAQQQAAVQIERRFAENNPQATAKEIHIQGLKFTGSGVVVGLVSSPKHNHKTPVWEQHLSVGAVGQNLLLAANAAGFAGVWLTGWLASDPGLCKIFGLRDHEQIAGFFHLGTAKQALQERPRPDMGKIVRHWS